MPPWPWSANAHSGWKPYPRLNVAAAPSLSECDVTNVASRSITTGDVASVPWSGACSPASAHAFDRAAARTVLIAVSARGASAASAVIARDTVGSDATEPKTPGSARSSATSARQSPPRASMTARSVMIFAGSCVANGLRHRASD